MARGTAVNFTKKAIEAMKEGDVLYDAEIKGLLIRAWAKCRSFSFAYTTHGGIRRQPKIGDYGALTIEAARQIAQSMATEVGMGGDPALKKEEARLAGPPATLKDLKARWDEELAKAKRRAESNVVLMASGPLKLKSKEKDLARLRPATLVLYEASWKHVSSLLGEETVLNNITKQNVESLRDNIAHGVSNKRWSRLRGGPIAANRALSFLCNIMNWAIEWKMRDAALGNPTEEVAFYEEKHRERFMSSAELTQFFGVTDKWIGQYRCQRNRSMARLGLLCLYQGARRGEFMKGRLSWIDWERKVYRLPAENHKTGGQVGAKEMVLGDDAIEILKGRHAEWLKLDKGDPEKDFIVIGKSRSSHRTNPKKIWGMFLKEAGIAELNLHDLRHTFATIALSLGYSLDQIGGVLGHKNEKITSRYAHRMTEPSRKLINETVKEMRRLASDSGKEKAIA